MQNLLLPILIFLPILVGLLLRVFGTQSQTVSRFISLGTAVIVLIGSIVLIRAVGVVPSDNSDLALIQPRVEYSPAWLSLDLPISIKGHPVHWQLHLGADGFSATLVFLSAIVTLAVLLTSQSQIQVKPEIYSGLILITQGLLIGVFLAMDLLLFYVFFEAVLIPIVILINMWGDAKESLRTARKFFLFTLAGSIPMVVGIVGLVLQSASTDQASTVSLKELSRISYAASLQEFATPAVASDNAAARAEATLKAGRGVAMNQVLILGTLLLGLGIKMALLPFHSWLPTTYTVSHPNTTALIAAVVGKLGVYGILRIVLPLTPLALSHYVQLIVGGLGAFAVVYGALVALGQKDLRSLLAYSSISHMGFVTVGLMAMNREGLSGASIQMLNHGIITAALFLLLGMIELRRGRLAMVEEYRGLASAYPILGTCMVFFTLAGAGLPGLNSFVGELLSMAGMIRVSLPITMIAVLGTVLGAWYALRVLQFILFGSDGASKERPMMTADVRPVDLVALLPLALICVVVGVAPQTATSLTQPDVDRLSKVLEPAAKGFHPDIDTIASNAEAK